MGIKQEWRKTRKERLNQIIADISQFKKAGGIATKNQVRKMARIMLDGEIAEIRKQAKANAKAKAGS